MNAYAVAVLILAALFASKVPAADGQVVRGERVVLLHGLARSASSMSRMASALQQAGYEVCNVSYPSRTHPIHELAVGFVEPAVRTCFPNNEQPFTS